MDIIEKTIEYCAKNKFIVILLVGVAILAGIFSIKKIPLDAIPDISQTQVIVYSKWDRPPQIIEDQVTYPIITALLGAPKVEAIRGISSYGASYVYVIFRHGTNIYWARNQIMTYLSKVTPELPHGVKMELGPDATSLGWIYEYALVDKTGTQSLSQLTTFQNWRLKYALQSVRGVAEVATIGGYKKEYRIIVNPNALLAYHISLNRVIKAVQESNNEVGARLLSYSRREFMVTIGGYIKSLHHIRNIVLKFNKNGVPIKIKNIAIVQYGPDIRRGVAELNGEGQVVGGIVIMRYGQNALKVINRVKKKLKTIQFPKGVKLVPTYDRSTLIKSAISTLKEKLIEELIVVSILIIIFLLHFPSAIIPIIVLPIAIILSFIPMYYMGLTANIMSLSGIAIAIGAMVDSAIFIVENVHKRLSLWKEQGEKGNYRDVIISSIKEVAKPSFFALLVIAISFMPIFSLVGMEGRLFRPLAFTKTFAMIFAAVLSITLVPAIITALIRVKGFSFKPRWFSIIINNIFVGKIHSEGKHPISRWLFKVYGPIVRFVLRKPKTIIFIAILLFLGTIPFIFKIGSEFMPSLNEGTLLYMPTALPGLSIGGATKILQLQDKILKTFPEVETVFGKAGRANTATDPAPLSMMETVIVLKPQNKWPHIKRWYSNIIPKFLQGPFKLIWPDRITWKQLVNRMNKDLNIPGVTNSWTMPIQARVDMLSTGIRTPLGVKVYGTDLKTIQEIGIRIQKLLQNIKGTQSIYAERTFGGYYVNIKLNKTAIARYGLTIGDIQNVLMSALGGKQITEVIKGIERFPVSIRYPRDFRDTISKIKDDIYVPTPQGNNIPLGLLVSIKMTKGPDMITNENGMLAGYVYIDTTTHNIGGYIVKAKQILNKNLKLPVGYSIKFSGQYKYMQRVKQKMKVVIPITLFIIFLLIYFNTKSIPKTMIIFTAVPFSLVGAIWILILLGYNFNIAVLVGIIALLGIDAETGVFTLLYLDLAYDERKKNGKMNTLDDLKHAIYHGSVDRIRPKIMVASVLFIGLLPIMLSPVYQIGADTMKRISAPLVGGIFTSTIMELIVYPAIYLLWKRKTVKKPDY
jgi:Cu(I)/Ag(I) efflux system membrane protein CusA/SilA